MSNLLRIIFNNLLYKNVKIIFPSFVDKDVFFEGHNFIGRFSHLKKTFIGRFTYLGNSCEFSNCKIGSFCSISKNVKVIIGTHPSSKWVSTHPLFYSKHCYVGDGFINETRYKEYKQTESGYYCEIGHDVWIGANVIILQGVKIGNGAIIGANSLVTKDIPPYSIAVGAPAKILKYRFDKEDIDLLEKIKWWDWDLKEIRENAVHYKDLVEFKNNL